MKWRKIQILALLAVSTLACAGRANVQADEQAIRALLDGWGKAATAGDVDALMKYYVGEPAKLGPGRTPIEGASAVRSMFTGILATSVIKTELVPQDIRVSGDLAVARGVQTGTRTPKAGGPASAFRVKWVGVYARQADGSWRCAYDIWNSDEPEFTGSVPDGQEALVASERRWIDALVSANVAALEEALDPEWTLVTAEGKTITRPQILKELGDGTLRVALLTFEDVETHVIDGTGVVRAVGNEKGMNRGKAYAARYRYTDTFAWRGGRWQLVATQATFLSR